jgi:KDO2-lipid IV(A) lauroyltransferase
MKAGRERTPTLLHRLEFAVFRVVRALVSAVPERIAVHAASVLGTFVGSVLRIRRADVDRHLSLAFPEWTPRARSRVARASYRHLAREAVVLFRLGGWSPEQVRERTEVEGIEAVREALERTGGVVLLTGHLGNWELSAAAVAAAGLPLDVIAKGMANRRFEEELFRTRARLGMRVVRMNEARRAVLAALRQGRAVGIVGDQDARRSGVFVPFFGRLASTARGAAVFALRTGAPVFLTFALRAPGVTPRYTMRFERLDFQPAGDADQDVERFARAYMAAVEAAVREAPEQYFWHHRRWRTRPPEEPGITQSVTTDETTALRASAGSDAIAREGHEP